MFSFRTSFSTYAHHNAVCTHQHHHRHRQPSRSTMGTVRYNATDPETDVNRVEVKKVTRNQNVKQTE